MQQARRTVEGAANAMDELKSLKETISESSKQVSGVFRSIDDFAFHTNFLALNAAVEAAQAGEAGAVFSVVAEEVRSLANRAAEAAPVSSDIIDPDHDRCDRRRRSCRPGLQRLPGRSQCDCWSRDMVSQIALSRDERARGITDIGAAITCIESATRGNVTSARETADIAEDVSNQIQTTRDHLDELAIVIGQKDSSTTYLAAGGSER